MMRQLTVAKVAAALQAAAEVLHPARAEPLSRQRRLRVTPGMTVVATMMVSMTVEQTAAAQIAVAKATTALTTAWATAAMSSYLPDVGHSRQMMSPVFPLRKSLSQLCPSPAVMASVAPPRAGAVRALSEARWASR